MNLFDKLFKTTFLNFVSSGLNFISNYFIVTWTSLAIFGELSIFNSTVSLVYIVFSVIPPNYSVFKLQDDYLYLKKLILYFSFSILLFILIIILLTKYELISIGLVPALIYALPIGVQNYLDIIYQANSKINTYYIILFLISFLKILFLFCGQYFGMINKLDNLIFFLGLPHFIIILPIFFKDFNKLFERNFIIEIKVFYDFFIRTSNEFLPYYTNTILKRLRENVIILVFSHIVTKEILGIFSLFLKVDQFVLGFVRNIEVFFMNRKNLLNYETKFNDVFIQVALTVQVLYVIIGCVYMKFMANDYYFVSIVLQSLIVYPYIKYLVVRAKLLSNYDNKEANFSELIFLTITLIIFGLSYISHYVSIQVLLITFLFSKFAQQMYLIFNKKARIFGK